MVTRGFFGGWVCWEKGYTSSSQIRPDKGQINFFQERLGVSLEGEGKEKPYIFMQLIRESGVDSLGTKPSKVGIGKVSESIKEFQLTGSVVWDLGAQHPSLWILSVKTGPAHRFFQRQMLVLATWQGHLDPFVGYLSLGEPLGPVWSAWASGLRGTVEEACCYLLKSREKTIWGSGVNVRPSFSTAVS